MYYVSKPDGFEDKISLDQMPARPLKDTVREAMLRKLADRAGASASVGSDGLESPLTEALDISLEQVHRCDKEHGSSLEVDLRCIDLGDDAVTIGIDLAPLLDRTGAEAVPAPAILVPMANRRNGRSRPILLETNACTARRDADLITLVADAPRCMEDLVTGRTRAVAELTARGSAARRRQPNPASGLTGPRHRQDHP